MQAIQTNQRPAEATISPWLATKPVVRLSWSFGGNVPSEKRKRRYGLPVRLRGTENEGF